MTPSLRETINAGSFFTLDREDILRIIAAEFPSELERLKTAYSIPPPVPNSAKAKARSESSSSSSSPYPYPSPSQLLFNSDYDEVNRTLVSLEALRWAHNDEYAEFVARQDPDPAVRLSADSFRWIRDLFCRVIGTGSDSADNLYTLVVSIVINDLGKSASLAEDFQGEAGKSEDARGNHDLLLYRVFTRATHLVPCLAKLPHKHRAHLERGIKMGASFNFGQLAQGENVPVSLVGLDCMRDNLVAFDLRFLEQILDIAGAAGHEDHTCAKKLTEPIFQSHKIVYEVSVAYLRGLLGRREAYDAHLVKMIVAFSFHKKCDKGQKLDISTPEDRAVMRLLCICNASGLERAELVWNAFYGVLGDETRRALVRGLNADGSVEDPAVQATYIPAVCNAAIMSAHSLPKDKQKKALGAVFRYLARVQIVAQEERETFPRNTAVIERDIRELALPVVSSPQFLANPDVLDVVDIPRGEVAILLPERHSGEDKGMVCLDKCQ
ncbi:uncharacterized protein BDV17DRAFT_293853 [Aspergillus undulatus]|uniref:uncharacterized protein n=1 Tax=Aspergillus undulatus TaxID=1810928 RepID=UPI003CCD6C1F